ncbi:hypothetical protein [Sulfurimonas sp.]|uniref:hypothetical protein n=1 Tax=Sulfurimonas sp. TaxID=2022749 RepID=UPI0039E728BE
MEKIRCQFTIKNLYSAKDIDIFVGDIFELNKEMQIKYASLLVTQTELADYYKIENAGFTDIDSC